MKVYDCFTFFNELDLLEIRLNELCDYVDYFVIVEATHTFQGKPKELILKNNWERFATWHDKIIHVIVDDAPNTGNAWNNEYHQRNAIARGLTSLQPEDLVIISDCDEIPRGEAIELIKHDTNGWVRYILASPMFQYKINYMKIFDRSVQRNIIVTRGKYFTSPQKERSYTFWWQNRAPADTTYIDHGGWHFSYFGDNDNAIKKLQSFSHSEENQLEIVKNYNIDYFIENKICHTRGTSIDKFEYAIVDEYFPEIITKNLERWQHMIVPNAVKTTEELYEINPRRWEMGFIT